MKTPQKSSVENHQNQDALPTRDSRAGSLCSRKIQTALFLVFSHARQHLGNHERQAINAFSALQNSFVPLWALYAIYFSQ